MDVEPLPLLIGLAAGLVAGFVNTLAGSGSFLTLPALIFMGLPSTVANGTNRVGILLSAVVAARTFHGRGALPVSALRWLLPPALAGAALGAWAAARLEPPQMDAAIGVAMLTLLAVVLLRPSRFLVDPIEPPRSAARPVPLLLAFSTGFYGGFLQAGVGLFLLAALVLDLRLPLSRANAAKVLLVAAFTVPALAVFAVEGQVRWDYGLVLAAAQMAGAWLGARFATRVPGAESWIRRLLVVVLAATAAKLLWPGSAGAGG